MVLWLKRQHDSTEPHKPVTQLRPLLPTHLSSTAHFTSPARRSFILVLCHQQSMLQFCSLGHIPNLVSHTSPSLLPDWFSHSPWPLPATTAMQLSPVSFVVGMRTSLLWLRIELWESFRWKWESNNTKSPRDDEQLTRKKSQLYGNVANGCSEVYRVLLMGVTDCFYRGRLWFRLYW